MVLIIGAGLSGLLTGYRLKKEGIPFKIFEARDRVGGRIHTVVGTDQTPVEMGATWFSEQHQNLIALLEELKIPYFEQYMKGKVFFQPMSTSPVQSIQVPSQAPSYRISGGSSNLVNILYNKLERDEVLLNRAVTEINFLNKTVQVFANEVFECDTVVLAIPPKLWSKRIRFQPQLPENLMVIATQTHTWMEDSIKIALTYEQPFWEQEQVSGTLFSNVGPITELYDHCNHERTTFALCGFINSAFKQLSYDERRARVIAQLKEVFGTKAESFNNYEECIWSKEQHTYENSESLLFPHQNNGNPIFSDSIFDGKLIISSSETAFECPGYMDGAVFAANMTAEKIIETQ